MAKTIIKAMVPTTEIKIAVTVPRLSACLTATMKATSTQMDAINRIMRLIPGIIPSILKTLGE